MSIDEAGPFITYANFIERAHGGPYSAVMHVNTVDDIREYTMELTYNGLAVKRMYGRHDDIPLLLMAAINSHQVDLAREKS